MSDDDQLRRFLFEDAPVRGHWVRLSQAWIAAREHQLLLAPMQGLLGESLAAASLLAASLKFQGTLTLQLAGSTGQVSMLVAQATDTRSVRGVIYGAHTAPAANAQFADLIAGGRLVVSMEQGDGVMPWQGVVPLDGSSLATCLEHYFVVSEQVPTAIFLAADAHRAAGLLLQKLPDTATQGEVAAAAAHDIWEESAALLATLQPSELLDSDAEGLLQRLFANRDVRLFAGEPVRFACRCDRERVAGMLQGIGQVEIESILREQGSITVTCEFCQKPYRFDAIDAAQLFVPAAAHPQSLN